MLLRNGTIFFYRQLLTMTIRLPSRRVDLSSMNLLILFIALTNIKLN